MKKIITLLKQEEEDSDHDDGIVFSDYEAAVAGVGDPMAPVQPPTSTERASWLMLVHLRGRLRVSPLSGA